MNVRVSSSDRARYLCIWISHARGVHENCIDLDVRGRPPPESWLLPETGCTVQKNVSLVNGDRVLSTASGLAPAALIWHGS